MLLLAAGGYTADAGSIRMSKMYSDGMVLQRDVPLVIKGQAAPGEKVTVKLEGPFRTMTGSAKASSEGLWEVTFSPLKAAVGITLTVEGKNDKIVYNDVAAGDIWVCSGQSNMFFRVFEGLEIGETPADSGLRLYNMRPRYYVNDERWPDEAIANTQEMDFYHATSWVVCDGENMRDFSAVDIISVPCCVKVWMFRLVLSAMRLEELLQRRGFQSLLWRLNIRKSSVLGLIIRYSTAGA